MNILHNEYETTEDIVKKLMKRIIRIDKRNKLHICKSEIRSYIYNRGICLEYMTDAEILSDLGELNGK